VVVVVVDGGGHPPTFTVSEIDEPSLPLTVTV
jgi:hypothetical protein